MAEKILFIVFYLRLKKKKFKKISELLIFAHFLFFGELCEWIAHFAQIKWGMWVNRSFRSPKMSDHERIAEVAHQKMSKWVNRSFFWANRSFAHSWTKNERFPRKSNERIPSPESSWQYKGFYVYSLKSSFQYEGFLSVFSMKSMKVNKIRCSGTGGAVSRTGGTV